MQHPEAEKLHVRLKTIFYYKETIVKYVDPGCRPKN